LFAGSDHFHGIVLTIIATISFVVGTIAFKRYTPKDGKGTLNCARPLMLWELARVCACSIPARPRRSNRISRRI
jgi:hypothetical protein